MSIQHFAHLALDIGGGEGFAEKVNFGCSI
jgi:hypothetical protein